MLCVTTVSYKVRINGASTSSFTPGRGLRQRDPLSPYLYILCAKALTQYTYRLSTSNKLLFLKIAQRGQRVGLLQFADDLLLFLQINERTMVNLSETLQVFEDEAGQRINEAKS